MNINLRSRIERNITFNAMFMFMSYHEEQLKCPMVIKYNVLQMSGLIKTTNLNTIIVYLRVLSKIL